MSEANNIISLPSESKIWYNTLYLASKIVCKKDENILVLFEFDIEPPYGRYPKRVAFVLFLTTLVVHLYSFRHSFVRSLGRR